MSLIEKIPVTAGVYFVTIKEADLFILCGCPADVVKHLIKTGLIKNIESKGVVYESGPNCILLSDSSIQNGQFANLAEFPVLQMLYRQGMIIPNHPNNKGHRPILCGNKAQLKAQMEYIYRGNYGLNSVEELKETGISEKMANDIYRMKIKFAFGKIRSTEEFLDTKEVTNKKVEIKNGVYIHRTSTNCFLLEYKGEKVEVDINLGNEIKYQAPFNLGFYQVKREYFSIIHCGEGDGWDVHRPCMGSILVYNGLIYLIDAGPNLINTLNALGISVSAVRGIFHTHCHDDHFNGITTLIQADHRIKYYAAPIVRASVSKKLAALLSVDRDVLSDYFEIKDLVLNDWNNVEGLLVRPTFSPHPVETTNFTFKVIAPFEHKTYAHLADISSFEVLESMITENDKSPGISRTLYEEVKENYLSPVDIKKIDAGGGLIHGKAKDFINDKSKKIILSHSSLELTSEEKEIGSRSSFGLADVLIPSNADQTTRYAKRYLHAYFPDLDFMVFRDLLNCPIVSYNAGDILYKKGNSVDHVLLTLTGTVEMIQSQEKIHQMLSAGSLIGDISALEETPIEETYVAVGYVWVLKIANNMYKDFALRHNLLANIISTQVKLKFLRGLWLFSEIAYSPKVNSIALEMEKFVLEEDDGISEELIDGIFLVQEGELELYYQGHLKEIVVAGDFCFEDVVVNAQKKSEYTIITRNKSILYKIPLNLIKDSPAVLWKVFEKFEKRKG